METHTQCEPCKNDDKHVAAKAWCSECEEAFCSSCEKAHKLMKISKEHHMIDIKLMPRSGQSALYIDKYCKEHSEQMIDSFCTSHDELCCRSCMIGTHRNCESILPIDVVSKNVKKSELFTSISKALNCISNTTKQIKESLAINTKTIKSEDSQIIKAVAAAKQLIIDQLDKAENDIISDLSNKKKEALSELQRRKEDVEQFDLSVQDKLKETKFVHDHGTDKQAFIFSHKFQEHLNAMEQTVVNINSQSKNYNISFEDKSGLFVPSPTTLGTITMKFDKLDIQFTPHYHHQAQAVAMPQRSFSRLEFKYQFDVRPGAIVFGMVVIEDKYLLICNSSKKLLMKCDFKGKGIQERILKSAPFGITLIPNTNTVVVTLPDIKSIQFVNDKNLTKGKIIELPGEGKGISASSEIIAIGGFGAIYILNVEGQYLRTLTVQSSVSFPLQYLKICSNSSFTYTDTKAVYCVNRNGEQIWKYESSNLETPQGITKDRLGYIYVVYQNSNSLIKLTENGKYEDTLLVEKDKLSYPWTLCFSNSYTNLLIGNSPFPEHFISVYSCIND